MFSPIEEVIDDIAAGKMVVLLDDESRENEGDLVIAADKATPQAINFMAKYGRGLICLSMTRERVEQLGLPLMSQRHSTRHQTAFTLSIEAREGVTTGISAADRAHTIAVAIDPKKNADDITTPGHIFPLVARDGGVLVRAGHTEAAVDLANLAGLNPAGVICEIMNDDGSMARLPDLIPFAKEHGLKLALIRDLIAYRRRFERLVERIVEVPFTSHFGGEFRLMVYRTAHTYAEHVVLVKGDLEKTSGPHYVRMHAMSVLDDVLGDTSGARAGDLQKSMEMIGQKGTGVVVLIREPLPTSLSERLQDNRPDRDSSIRDYGVGAQILLDLGVRDMVLLTNSKRQVVGLDGYGLTIKGYEPIIKGS